MHSFIVFTIVQFLAALNENYLRFTIAFFLIYEMSHAHTSVIMTETSMLFLLPFLLFSTLGGLLADRFSKQRVMLVTRGCEILLLCLALIGVILASKLLAYIALFLMATTSALFGPAKYGLIPELSENKTFIRANSITAAFTYFGIILGTALASLIAQVSHEHYIFSIAFAISISLFSFVLSFFVSEAPAANPSTKITLFYFKELLYSLKEMRNTKKLLPVAYAYAYFLLLGAFLQINIVPFTKVVLSLSPLIGGYLFFITSIGIGLGAFIAPKFSKTRINLASIPLSGLGVSLTLFALAFWSPNFTFACFWLVIIGIFGGLFLVPAQSYIIHHSPTITRGRTLGTANFLSFLFALLAPIFVYIFNTSLALSPDTTFTIFAFINILVMLGFALVLKNA